MNLKKVFENFNSARNSREHHQRFCPTSEGRTQTVPLQGLDTSPQGPLPVALPRSAGLLCRPGVNLIKLFTAVIYKCS
jgi:hypothetical protein